MDKNNVYLTNDFVVSGYDSQTRQAVFLPRPENIDVVSQPVNVNQNGNAQHTSSFSMFAYK